MSDQTPETMPMVQTVVDKKPGLLQIDPSQPIKFHILLLGGQRQGVLVCKCSNKEQSAFAKYIGTKLEPNEKGYLKSIKTTEIMCNKCKASVPFSVLAEQHKQLTTI